MQDHSLGRLSSASRESSLCVLSLLLSVIFFCFLSPPAARFVELFEEHREADLTESKYLKDSFTKRDVFVDFMCRSHFLVAFVFVGTDFNCFLKSIRRSIPMTVAVKLTSTRRCMTCSFFVAFFVFIKRERSGCMRRGHCAAQ